MSCIINSSLHASPSHTLTCISSAQNTCEGYPTSRGGSHPRDTLQRSTPAQRNRGCTRNKSSWYMYIKRTSLTAHRVSFFQSHTHFLSSLSILPPLLPLPPPPLSPWSTHLVGTAATSGRTLLRCQALPARPLAPETRLTPPPLQATSTLLAANIPETGQRSQIKRGRSRGRTIIHQGSKVVNHVSSADASRPACGLRKCMHSGPDQS